jgi:hypothetical protein
LLPGVEAGAVGLGGVFDDVREHRRDLFDHRIVHVCDEAQGLVRDVVQSAGFVALSCNPNPSKGWLERISSGAVDLAGEIFYSEARRKERESGVPGFAGRIDNCDLPPQPLGEPGPNNSIFDIMKQRSLQEGGIEMAENPMLKSMDEKGKKGFKNKSDGGEGRLRAPSKAEIG